MHLSASGASIPDPRVRLQISPQHKGDHGRTSCVEALALEVVQCVGVPLGRDIPGDPAVCIDVEIKLSGMREAACLYFKDALGS